MPERDDASVNAPIPDTARLVYKTTDWPRSEAIRLVLCIGGGNHAIYTDKAAREYARCRTDAERQRILAYVEIGPCDCDERGSYAVPELVKARLRKVVGEGTKNVQDRLRQEQKAPDASSMLPEHARLVSSAPHWPGSDHYLHVACFGNGYHAEFCDGDTSAKISPCDCDSKLMLIVPEFIKASFRRHLEGK